MGTQETNTAQTQSQFIQPMSPEDALTVLDQASSLAMLTRADHVRVHVAVQTIRSFIESVRAKSKQEQSCNAR